VTQLGLAGVSLRKGAELDSGIEGTRSRPRDGLGGQGGMPALAAGWRRGVQALKYAFVFSWT
jgi:hypothetical protein